MRVPCRRTSPKGSTDQGSAKAGRWKSVRRRLAFIGVVMVVCLVGIEVIGRVFYGLGNPPLFMADDQIEYLYKPSAEYWRRGNRLYFNAYSMRSDDFPAERHDPAELRIMVIGDSIINGGAHTDQDELATTILQKELSARLNRPVIVGNISAGSWGPPNMLAYVQRFGLFDADIVIIVVSSHDAADVPTFAVPVGTGRLPSERPVSAITELLGIAVGWLAPRHEEPRTDEQLEDVRATATAAFAELIRIVRGSGADAIVVQHLFHNEVVGEIEPGHGILADIARDAGIEPLQLGPAFAQAIEMGKQPYRNDMIHPSVYGQQVLASVIFNKIMALESLRSEGAGGSHE